MRRMQRTPRWQSPFLIAELCFLMIIVLQMGSYAQHFRRTTQPDQYEPSPLQSGQDQQKLLRTRVLSASNFPPCNTARPGTVGPSSVDKLLPVSMIGWLDLQSESELCARCNEKHKKLGQTSASRQGHTGAAQTDRQYLRMPII